MNQEMNDLINALNERNIDIKDFKKFEYKHFKFKSFLVYVGVFIVLVLMGKIQYFPHDPNMIKPYILSMALLCVLGRFGNCIAFKYFKFGTNYLLSGFKKESYFEKRVNAYLKKHQR